VIESSKIWAIVPAAGVGSRMNDAVPKQYLEIHGKTILEHTLESLLKSNKIDGIVVSLSEGDRLFEQLPIAENPRIRTVVGGATRAESVLNGLAFLQFEEPLENQADWALVHDAARPCLSEGAISRMIERLAGDAVGGILAIPAIDTLKRANTNQEITETVDRERIWQAQTPQMFRRQLLSESLSKALENDVQVTDEASAMEWAGYKPKLIHGEVNNLKITTPQDLTFAEFLLREPLV